LYKKIKSEGLSPRADIKVAGRHSPNSVARPTRFILIFAISFLLGLGILGTTPARTADAKLTSALVAMSHGLVNICGGKSSVQGAVMRNPVSGFAIEMKDGCNAIYVTILLLSAMVAFPAPWKLKISGLFAGTLIVQSLNIIRFISLFYIGQYSVSGFNFAHKYLWETLLVLDTMIVFWVWANLVHRSRVTPNDGR
jgi:exosortase H (IPTLxxWG-CTERM-specific)